MFPILILREEIVCLIILVFLLLASFSYHIGKDQKHFTILMWFAIAHVVFDIITVVTVNNINDIPSWLNELFHIIFYLTAIGFANEIFQYSLKKCYPNFPSFFYAFGWILPFIYVCFLPFLKIEYVYANGTYSSTGPAAYVGFGIGFLYFLVTGIFVLINFKKLDRNFKRVLFPTLCALILSEIFQIVWKEFLFTGAAVTLVTVGFFFSLENPAHVFEKKAMTDVLTGVLSRNSYEEKIARLDEKFKKDNTLNFIFVFCDLNNLKAVNGIYGHSEGDNYITLIAKTLTTELKSSSGIFRMGGDEFVALYEDVAESIVINELKAVNEKCVHFKMKYPYAPSVALGYASSNPNYKSLRDVLRTADYMMYKNKTEMKHAKAMIKNSTGTSLNLTGLTDSVFNAMCSSNDRSYPFILNLETNVTRISPKWRDYFGFEDEFFENFLDKWAEKIHPEDKQAYIENITAAISEKIRYHNSEYRALNKNGEYVKCSCHGSVYHGTNGEPDIFAGYMVNYGVQNTIDSTTGLRDFSVLDNVVLTYLEEKKNASILKLRINNFSRFNMIYGYKKGNLILKSIADFLVREIGNKGEVYCNDSIRFSIFLYTDSKETVTDTYHHLAHLLARGISFENVFLPINLSGGAIILNSEKCYNIETIRTSLLFAMEESTYNRQGHLVFTDEIPNTTDEESMALLNVIHKDARGGRKGFKLRYQPILDTQTEKIQGVEALLRWVSPEYGEVPPLRFIGILESDPCFYKLGLYIIKTAIKEMKSFLKDYPDFKVSVNITALQLRHDEFLEEVLDICNQENFPVNNLVLELTERCKEMDVSYLTDKIAEIRKTGIKVAFDDIGTGYSTFNLLLNIPVDEIKLDWEFVIKLQEDPVRQLFVEAITKGVRSRNAKVCFEGVETKELSEFVKQYGESWTQGYYFALPLYPNELVEFLHKKS